RGRGVQLSAMQFRNRTENARLPVRAKDLRMFNLIGGAEILVDVGAFLRQRGEPLRLRLQFFSHLVIENGGYLDQVHVHVARRAAEPGFQIAIQNADAENDQKEHGQKAEGERTANQFQLDMRAGSVYLAFDIELDAGAKQHEA